MTEVEETRPILLRVGFKVEKIIDLVGSRFWPFFQFVQDIECGQHSISVWSNLEGGDIEIISHALVKRM